MTPVHAQPKSEEFVYIDLDAPSPWWASVVGTAAAILIVAVLIAPWAINWNDESPDQVANNALQTTGTLCRPNSGGLPGFFDPTVASWNRFCEWFIEPGTDTP